MADHRAESFAWTRRILVLLVIFCTVSTRSYGSQPGVLKGTVTDPSGAVMSGVLVRLVHWKPGDNRRFQIIDNAVSYTDDHGSFSFTLEPKVYDIFVSYPPFSPVAMKVLVKGGSESVFSPELKYDPLIHFVE